MGRARSRPTSGVQEPEVRVRWVRAEPTPLQALAWRRLWQRLLAPHEADRETASSPTAVQAGHETCANDEHEHDRLQDQ
jgi:hypothetical protein